MVYKKVSFIAILIAIIAAVVCNFTFATNEVLASTMNILIFIQKYSWPVVTLVFIYALYQFYVAGSEILEHKILGQRLIVGLSIFMCLIQCLPLIYAFFVV